MIVADKFDDLLGTRPNPQTEEIDEPQDEYDDDVQEDEEEETEEVEAAPQVYKVIIDGEEVEVSLDELQKGYSQTE
jgi:hypothetical protein